MKASNDSTDIVKDDECNFDGKNANIREKKLLG